MAIDYDHSPSVHTLEGPRVALPLFFESVQPRSVLDVGCGVGAWLKAARECGVSEVRGLDGVLIPEEKLLFPLQFFQLQDLTVAFDLGRRFDAVICLEVAEHLHSQHASLLIGSLTRHSDLIFFSAACPGQYGQHHVNGQWPAFWQGLFNEQGFKCSDELRWKMWEEARIEPWYRQNLLVARRVPSVAGTEPRIKAVVHPEMQLLMKPAPRPVSFEKHVAQIEHGSMPAGWYLRTTFLAFAQKAKRIFGKPT